MKKVVLLFAILIFLTVSSTFAAEYKIDPNHSSISFKVRHLFSKVEGRFEKYEGSFTYEPDHPEVWKAQAVIQAHSIDTGVPDRDQHLKSPDFFDVEKYPTIEFTSTGVEEVTASQAKLNGIFKMHGVEKPVSFDIEIYGQAADPWGNTRLGATATSKINRKDFGLNWNKTVETGQLLVGEEVEITVEIEGIQEKTAEPAEKAAAETAEAQKES